MSSQGTFNTCFKARSSAFAGDTELLSGPGGRQQEVTGQRRMCVHSVREQEVTQCLWRGREHNGDKETDCGVSPPPSVSVCAAASPRLAGHRPQQKFPKCAVSSPLL